MPWRDDIAAGLPPDGPRRSEPSMLRQDILDELADHLECAVRRELRTTNDAEEARRAALAGFGDPQAIARRLWLDAMKERLMSQRMMVGTQIVLAAMVIVLGVVVFTQYQSQKNQQAMLVQLRMMSEQARADAVAAEARARADRDARAAEASLDWPQFTVQLLAPDGKGGVEGQELYLGGEVYNVGKAQSIRAVTDRDGRADFGRVRAGGYTLRSIEKDGIWLERSVVAPPGPSQPLLIQWIDSPRRPMPTAIQMSLDKKIEYPWLMLVTLRCRPIAGEGRQESWKARDQYMLFDERGRVAQLNDDTDPSQHLDSSVLDTLAWSDKLDLDASLRYEPSSGKILMGRDDVEHPTDFSQFGYIYSYKPERFDLAGAAGGSIVLLATLDHEQELRRNIDQQLLMQKKRKEAQDRRDRGEPPTTSKGQ